MSNKRFRVRIVKKTALGVGGMDYLDRYLLEVIASFPMKRKPAFLYAVVTGKRTGQAVQDSHLFGVTRLFGCAPMLKSETFDARLASMMERDILSITEDGVEIRVKADIPFVARFPYLDGFAFQNRTDLFFERLLLAVQVFSNFKHERKHYLPIVRDDVTQLAVKFWLADMMKSKSKEMARRDFYKELEKWFLDGEPRFYVPRFSGGDYIGKTGLQVANELDLAPWEYYFEWLNGLHQLFAKLDTEFPILNGLMPDSQLGLTASAQKTWQLWQQNVPMEKMMDLRRLKLSTIQDHIVEIAATIPNFSVDAWINEAAVISISEQQWISLKDIKQAFPNLDYFQIRLALVAKRRGAICS